MSDKPQSSPGNGDDSNSNGQQQPRQDIELGVIHQFSQFNFFPEPPSESRAKVTSSPSASLPSSNTSKSRGTDPKSLSTPQSHDAIQPAGSPPRYGAQQSASTPSPTPPHSHDRIEPASYSLSQSHDWILPESSSTTISTHVPGSAAGLGLTMPSQDKDGVFPVPTSPIPVHRFPKKGSTCTVTTASTSRPGEGEDDSDGTITWTEAEEKKLVRKLDWCFLPTVWLMALMSWMDRSSIGNAQLAGMGLDLDLSDDQYSMVIVVFYFGYVTCGPLSNLILSRTRPRLYLPILVGCWGLLTLSMAFVTNYTNLLMLRFCVGVFESGLSPATIFLISCWYRPDEQGKRISATLSAALLGGAFGGIISGSAAAWLEGVNHIRGWKWLFGIEGVFTIVWATISYWLMVDFPGSESTAKRFGERGRQIAVGRVKKEGVLLGRLDGEGSLTAAVERLGKAKSIRVALSDWRVWTITVGVGLLGCSTVLAYFYPILIFEMGFESITQTQFMTIPIWIMAVISAVLVGYFADSFPLRRSLMMAACMGSAAVFSSLVCVIQSPHARYGLLFFMAGGVWSSIALYLSLLAFTFSDMHPEARAFALALPGAVGNLGNVYGAYLFPGSDMPEYFMGFGVIAGTLGAGAVLFFVFHVLLRKRRLLRVDE